MAKVGPWFVKLVHGPWPMDPVAQAKVVEGPPLPPPLGQIWSSACVYVFMNMYFKAVGVANSQGDGREWKVYLAPGENIPYTEMIILVIAPTTQAPPVARFLSFLGHQKVDSSNEVTSYTTNLKPKVQPLTPLNPGLHNIPVF